MCVLNDRMLRQWAEFGGLTPYDPECINSASVDLKWSGRWRKAIPGEKKKFSEIAQTDALVLGWMEFFLLDTMEFIKIPYRLCGDLMSKSTPARDGIEHLHAGFFDPGFGEDEMSTGTLEVINLAPWPVKIEKGQRIVQLKLTRMVEEPMVPYNKKPTSHYNGQRGPTPGWK